MSSRSPEVLRQLKRLAEHSPALSSNEQLLQRGNQISAPQSCEGRLCVVPNGRHRGNNGETEEVKRILIILLKFT
jgi:hypothetical protein